MTVKEKKIWDILATVCDPEVPVLTILDLGIVREVNLEKDAVTVVITPTYTGCPAMDMISMQIRMALLENGYTTVHLQTVLAPAWTTDWMTEAGKQKLQAYGIAPPQPRSSLQVAPGCPQCGSTHTILISEFGSTACKSLYKCETCLEPFDYFKCH